MSHKDDNLIFENYLDHMKRAGGPAEKGPLQSQEVKQKVYDPYEGQRNAQYMEPESEHEKETLEEGEGEESVLRGLALKELGVDIFDIKNMDSEDFFETSKATMQNLLKKAFNMGYAKSLAK